MEHQRLFRKSEVELILGVSRSQVGNYINKYIPQEEELVVIRKRTNKEKILTYKGLEYLINLFKTPILKERMNEYVSGKNFSQVFFGIEEMAQVLVISSSGVRNILRDYNLNDNNEMCFKLLGSNTRRFTEKCFKKIGEIYWGSSLDNQINKYIDKKKESSKIFRI